jgi:hypothetical protein
MIVSRNSPLPVVTKFLSRRLVIEAEVPQPEVNVVFTILERGLAVLTGKMKHPGAMIGIASLIALAENVLAADRAVKLEGAVVVYDIAVDCCLDSVLHYAPTSDMHSASRPS